MRTRRYRIDRSTVGRSILVAALLAASSAGAATPWKFHQVVMLTDATLAHVVQENVTSTGGTVVINVEGQTFGLCPGGIVQLRFTWRFDKDITYLTPGERFGGVLRAEQISTTPDCGNKIAARAQGSIGYGAGGIPWANWTGPGSIPHWDGNRFETLSLSIATANPERPDTNAESSVLKVSDLEPYSDRPAANFPVTLDSAGGKFFYLYVYEPVKAPTEPGLFENPTVNGRLVDNCLNWGVRCGQAAADHFCQRQGFGHAVDFQVAPMHPTLVMGDDKLCDAPYCAGFTRIRCTGTVAKAPPQSGQPRQLGGLDLQAFCKAHRADRVDLKNGTWLCNTGGVEAPINLEEACRWQYNAPYAQVRQRTPGDPQTWTCWQPGFEQ